MRKTMFELALFVALVLPAGLTAQGGAAVHFDLGADLTSRHIGPTVELRVATISGDRFSHGFGVGITVGTNYPGDLLCTLTAHGVCVDYGPTLTTAFYEPRLYLGTRGSAVRPFVNGRVSFVQGWGGIGGGFGGGAGVDLALGNGWGASASAMAGILATRAAGRLGEDWEAFRSGFRLGLSRGF